MKKIFSKLSQMGKKAKVAITSAIMAVSTTALLVCSATGEETTSTPTVSTLTDTVASSLEEVLVNTFEMLAAVLPFALGIVGAGLVISYGIKAFKKISKQG